MTLMRWSTTVARDR